MASAFANVPPSRDWHPVTALIEQRKTLVVAIEDHSAFTTRATNEH